MFTNTISLNLPGVLITQRTLIPFYRGGKRNTTQLEVHPWINKGRAISLHVALTHCIILRLDSKLLPWLFSNNWEFNGEKASIIWECEMNSTGSCRLFTIKGWGSLSQRSCFHFLIHQTAQIMGVIWEYLKKSGCCLFIT